MRNLFSTILIVLLVVLSGQCYAQDRRDSSKHECFNAIQVSVPFSRVDFKIEKQSHEEVDVLNKSYYLHEDEYTFWYKFVVDSDAEVDVSVSSTREKDIHEMVLYEYNDSSFCKDVVYGEYKSTTLPNWKVVKIKDGSMVSTTDLKLKKGSTYYLSVLNLNMYNCGHILRVQNGKQVLRMNAIQRDCFRFPEAEEVESADQLEDTTLTVEIVEDTVVEVVDIEPVVEDTSLIEEPIIEDTVETVVIPEPLVEEKVVLSPFVELKGYLLDNEKGTKIEGEFFLQNTQTKEVFQADCRKNKGFRVQLERGATYKVVGRSKYHLDKDSTLVADDDQIFELGLDRLGVGDNIVFRNIYFYPNIYKIKESSNQGLTELYNFMSENPNYKIEVQGHTAGNRKITHPDDRYRGKGKDWQFTGTAKQLSKLRANEVKEFLVEKGIASSRMKVKGYGDEQKIIETPRNREERMMNMRVEIIIISD